MPFMFSHACLRWLTMSVMCCAFIAAADRAPNIILVMPDDAGYGDYSCNGSPIMKTPAVDAFAKQSIRFTQFQVSPTCAPTRASLLTGCHEFRNGVTHTILERERMSLQSITLPQVLGRAGYASAIFGKWHLGDEVAYRPTSRGFTDMFIHGGGGIGQTHPGSCGDAPGNTNFNPAILHNEKFVKTMGYCTDLFFNQAISWIDEKRKSDKPFYAQITTNVPHTPHTVSDELVAHYRDKVPEGTARFYAMLETVDTNFGNLIKKLDEWGLAENTLVIYIFSDNGGTEGVKICNDGMRGKKGTPYRGGVRVGSLWRWPSQWKGGVDCAALTAHIDVLPTLAGIVGIPLDEALQNQIDGRSMQPLLANVQAEWPNRTLVTHVGRWGFGKAEDSKFSKCSIRDERFSLVENKELFDLRVDPGEVTNVIDQHPEVVARLRAEYDKWWSGTVPLLVNEDANKTAPKINPFKEQYWAQFGGEPDAALLKRMDPTPKEANDERNEQ
jgi:arylsulfatase